MRKVIPLAVAGGVLVASGGVFGAAQALAKDVELTQDGVPMKVRTWDGTVGRVLEKQGITLGEHDVVAPAASEKISDGQQISVRYGRQLHLTVDGQPETMWTTALTLDEALAERSIREESRMSASRNASIGRDGLSVEIETAKKITIVIGGESSELITPAETVGEALAEANVTLGPEDRVEPALETPVAEDLTVAVHKVETKETTKDVEIPFKTVRKDSSTLPKGTEKVETKGVPGKAVEVWVEKFQAGQSISNEKTSTRVEKEPIDEVILVGTASTRTPSASPSASRSTGSSANLTPAQGASCIASNYWEPQPTASGERFDPNAMTAAHKTLPMHTRVKVTNPRNGKTVIVRINDRGPYIAGRCLDLSRASFAAIGDLNQGIMTVNYEVLR